MQLNLTGTPEEITHLLTLLRDPSIETILSTDNHTKLNVTIPEPIPELVVDGPQAETPPTEEAINLSGEQVREVINRYGGPANFARLLGVGRTTVQGWKSRESIPDNWVKMIKDLPPPSQSRTAPPRSHKPTYVSSLVEDRRSKVGSYYDSVILLMNILATHPVVEIDDLHRRSGMHSKRFEIVMGLMTEFGWATVNDQIVAAGQVKLGNQLPPVGEKQTTLIQDTLRRYPGSTAGQIAQRTLIASNLVASRLLFLKDRVYCKGAGGNIDPKRWFVRNEALEALA